MKKKFFITDVLSGKRISAEDILEIDPIVINNRHGFKIILENPEVHVTTNNDEVKQVILRVLRDFVFHTNTCNNLYRPICLFDANLKGFANLCLVNVSVSGDRWLRLETVVDDLGSFIHGDLDRAEWFKNAIDRGKFVEMDKPQTFFFLHNQGSLESLRVASLKNVEKNDDVKELLDVSFLLDEPMAVDTSDTIFNRMYKFQQIKRGFPCNVIFFRHDENGQETEIVRMENVFQIAWCQATNTITITCGAVMSSDNEVSEKMASCLGINGSFLKVEDKDEDH